MIEFIITIGLILSGLVVATFFLVRSFRESKHILHYKNIVDILTLRKHKKKAINTDEVSNKDHIKHYEQIRDKLTTRKKEEPEEEYTGGGIGLGNIIGAFVAIIVGVSLIGPISEQVNIASQSSMNVSGTTTPTFGLTVLKLVPAFFAIGILGIGIAVLWGALRNSGLVGGGGL